MVIICFFMYNLIGDIMIVCVERLDDFGRGIAYVDGKICFIPNTLPGESVDIEIVKSTKKYIEASVISYLTKSKKRVNHKCPYFSFCGGCQFLNISIQEETKYKTNKIKSLVKKFTNLDNSIVRDCITLNEYNYRNKITFHVKDKKLGFYKEKTNELVEINKCLLVDEKINLIINKIKQVVLDNDIDEVSIRVGNNMDTMSINFVGKIDDNSIFDSFKESIYVNGKCINYPFISNIGDYKFYVSPLSFFQVNSEVVEPLYNNVLEYCKNNNINSVLDLYCGAGTIGIYISSSVDNVLGIDSCSDAILNANDNKKLNNVNNVSFVCSKVEDYVDKLKDNYDLVVVDPPRSGLDSKTIDYLLDINSRSIIYISCDPVTLVRDLNILSGEYEVKSIQPYNMFPKCYHCESITVLERR